MPRMPDGTYIAHQRDAARIARSYVELVDNKQFARLLDKVDDDAERAASGAPDAPHPNAVIVVLAQCLAALARRHGSSGVKVVQDYREFLEKDGSRPDLWRPSN